MATTSEIQVTEAYIGLLGRAPDPAGLAYWVAELDAAIASGTSAAVALKKLTNDITLSTEWDNGIGANDGTTEAGSEAIVTAMYDNLFDRAASQVAKTGSNGKTPSSGNVPQSSPNVCPNRRM